MTLTIETIGRQTVAALDRPHARNPIELADIRELTRLFGAPPPDCSAIVVTGRGGNFTSGMDSSAGMAALRSGWRPGFADLLDLLFDMWLAMAACPVPTVAAVEGWCVGSGANLALFCDVRVGSRSARLLAGHASIGSVPDGGGSLALVRALGFQHASNLYFTNKALDAATLAGLGVFAEVVDEGAALDAALQLAEGFPAALRAVVTDARRLFDRAAGFDLKALHEAECQIMRPLVDSGQLLRTIEGFWDERRSVS
ncbi:MAG TPA: enoyl-CoA hydratase/isomerase family protein [Streptosporangiaceae bacterium]